jgi:hypothetical protein
MRKRLVGIILVTDYDKYLSVEMFGLSLISSSFDRYHDTEINTMAI